MVLLQLEESEARTARFRVATWQLGHVICTRSFATCRQLGPHCHIEDQVEWVQRTMLQPCDPDK